MSGVTARSGLRQKSPELRQLRRLRLENANREKRANGGVSSPVTAPLVDDLDAIEERAGLAADCVPACYLDAWARLQCQRPFTIDFGREWRRAINDAGLFLDAWGADAAAMRWSAGELFDVPRAGRPGGLVWQLEGERVEALGADHGRASDGRVIERRGILALGNKDRGITNEID